MRVRAAIAGALVAAALAACGGKEEVEPSEPLPRVQVTSGQATDIGALPTVAPPPALKVEKKTADDDAQPVRTPEPTPTPGGTPDGTTVEPFEPQGPVSAAPTPADPTPSSGETLGPEEGGG